MATSIAELQELVIAAIKERLPDLRACEPFSGRFTADSLKRFSTHVPAVLVSVLRTRDITQTDDETLSATLVLSAFIVAKDSAGLKRNVAALNIGETLLTLTTNNNWGGKGVGIPRGVNLFNLYDENARNNALAIYSVSWNQSIQLGVSTLNEDGTLPTALYISSPPLIGEGHEDDYTEAWRREDG